MWTIIGGIPACGQRARQRRAFAHPRDRVQHVVAQRHVRQRLRPASSDLISGTPLDARMPRVEAKRAVFMPRISRPNRAGAAAARPREPEAGRAQRESESGPGRHDRGQHPPAQARTKSEVAISAMVRNGSFWRVCANTPITCGTT